MADDPKTPQGGKPADPSPAPGGQSTPPEPEGQGGGHDPSPSSSSDPKPQGDGGQPAGASEAEIRARLEREFNEKLKKATGAESLSALEAQQRQQEEERLRKQGEFEKLAESRGKEAEKYKGLYHQTLTTNALLSAAGAAGAVDGEVVAELLRARASVGDDGKVTVDGQAPKAAVEALLKEKPYLAQAAGGEGGGAPAGGEAARGADLEQAKKAGDVGGMLAALRTGKNQ